MTCRSSLSNLIVCFGITNQHSVFKASRIKNSSTYTGRQIKFLITSTHVNLHDPTSCIAMSPRQYLMVLCLLPKCSPAVLAYFVAAFSPNMDVANAVLPTYVVTLLFFGGFLFRFSAMPAYWKWYRCANTCNQEVCNPGSGALQLRHPCTSPKSAVCGFFPRRMGAPV